MGHMKFENIKPYEDYFWKKNRLELVFDYVESIDPDQKKLVCKSGNKIDYDILIIATGSKPNSLEWPGKKVPGVQGLVSLQDLELMEKNTKNVKEAVIVGGGLIGIEMAEMLRTRNIHVTMLVREKSFWDAVLPKEESAMVNGHIREHGVDLQLNDELKEIVSSETGSVSKIITTTGKEIPCQFVGVAIGVAPNIQFIKGSAIKTRRGVLVNEYFETNIRDVYAIGDCAEFEPSMSGRKPIEQLWYTGRMHGETLALTLCGQKTAYKPGPWFNSAKFFDIEYQVYGEINPVKKNDEEQFYWEHKDGKKAIRIAFNKESKKLLGIVVMGIRYRHEVCDRWIRSGTLINEVLKELKKANFDPELFKKYEDEIIEKFSTSFPELEIQPPKRKKAFGIF